MPIACKELCLIAALVAALTVSTDSPAAPPSPSASRDSIEGKWSGLVGNELERVPFGLEFVRNDRGELDAFFTQFSYFHTAMPGGVKRNGNTWELADWGMKLELDGDTIRGTMTGLQLPITLARTNTLPLEVPIPPLSAGPGPVWRHKLGGAIYGAAAVRDGLAYVGTTGGLLHAVDLRDGKVAWTFLAGRPIHGQPLATESGVYFSADSGYLYKLEPKTGKEIWRYDLGDARVPRALEFEVVDFQGGDYDWDRWSPQPVLADGVLFVGSGDGSLHSIDASTGARRWRFEGAGKMGKIRTDVALDGKRAIFGSWDYNVYAVDRATGKELWRKDTRSQVTSTPVMIGGKAIVGTRGGMLAALDPATGTVAWRSFFWGSSVESTPVMGEGTLFYIGSSDLRRVSLIDARDGRVHWRTDVFGVSVARPALGEKLLYASVEGVDPSEPRHEGGLVALDRTTGAIAWRWPASPAPGAFVSGFVASPVVASGLVVVGGLDGTLYAFPAEK